MGSNEQHRAERIFATILGALSNVLIKNNVPLKGAVEILKRCLVESADEGNAATDSLISLRTGVHRKDVKRLRSAIAEGTTENSPIRGLAIVLATWSNEAPFLVAPGQRRILQRKGSAGAPGFDDLVRTSKVDLAPATVLRELQAQSLVKIHDDGGIELLSSTLIAQSGEAALDAFEATIADHIRVAANNVLSPPGAPRHFDQVLRYSHLSAASVETLEAEARRLAQEYLEQMNALAHRLQSEDDASGQLANGRFVTGAYVAPVLPDAAEGAETTTTSPKKDQAE